MLARDGGARVDEGTERLMDKAKDGVLPFEIVGVEVSGSGGVGWDFIRLSPPGGVA